MMDFQLKHTNKFRILDMNLRVAVGKQIKNAFRKVLAIKAYSSTEQPSM